MRQSKLIELKEKMEKYATATKSEARIVNNGFIKIAERDYELRDGSSLKWQEIVKNGGNSSASVILPITKTREVLLIIQPRVLTREGVALEIPAGYMEEGETGKEAAERELLEETGYKAEKIIKVDEFYQDQGCSEALNECFIAYGCEKIKDASLDQDEHISTFLCTYEEMLELYEMGYIKGAGDKITIMNAKTRIRM